MFAAWTMMQGGAGAPAGPKREPHKRQRHCLRREDSGTDKAAWEVPAEETT